MDNHPRQKIISEETSPRIFQLITLICGPLALLFFLLLPQPVSIPEAAWLLLGLIIWMVTWWIGEFVPIAITALLPLVMMPLLNIAPQKVVSSSYGHPLIFLFFGGFVLASAVQRYGLHRRIALYIVFAMGKRMDGIIGGFMLATAFLSMWISNTAATILMFAVGMSVINFVSQKLEDQKQSQRFSVALVLAIAYSASIGGVATLIGTPPNALLASFLSESYQIHIDFATWMLIGIPLTIIMLPLCWLLLCRVIFKVHKIEISDLNALIHNQIRNLDQASREEIIVAWIFALTALAWISRQWLVSLTGLNITDTSIAIIAAVILFAIPFRQGGVLNGESKFRPLLRWTAVKDIPWNILLLFGGGLAVAGAFQSSGLAETIGQSVAQLGHFDYWILVLVVITTIIFLTEITSNTATTATFLPILGAIAIGLGESPTTLTIPAALAASMAFMLPVATPPNAIVFSYEDLHIKHMVGAGLWLNLCTITLVFMAAQWLLPLIH